MRPTATVRTAFRVCIASSSRPRPPVISSRHPSPLGQITAMRYASMPGWDWINSRLAMRERGKLEAERQREAREEQIEKGEASIFDVAERDAEKGESPTMLKLVKKWKEHKYSTASFKISPRKLNMLANQIGGKPIDVAILQMQFSDKRAAKRIKSTLCVARDHAEDKGLRRERMVVAESWVAKGRRIKRRDIKGRGRMGVKDHTNARLHVLLKEGKTLAEKKEERRLDRLGKVRSAGLAREDMPIRNAGWTYAW